MFVAEANKLEEFISIVKQKSLWIGAVTMFGACLIFLWKSYLEMPEKYLAHQQYAETLSNLEDEQRRQSRVIELFETSINDFGPLLQFYIDHIEAGGSEATKSSVRLRLIADRTSARLHADISESEGILLQGDTYQKLHLRLLEGTKLVLELSEAFHASSASMSSKAVRRTLSDKYKQVMLANTSVAGSVIPAFSTQTIADKHALEMRMVELTALNRQSWLAACAVLYLFLFTLFCIVRFSRFRRNFRAPVT
jgi:hypothetical protein